MTELQKKKYYSYLITKPMTYKEDIEERDEILSLLPKSLFKYSPCNENTFKNISHEAQYLSPIDGLDDPFDCLVDAGDFKIIDEKTNLHSKKFVEFLAKKFIKSERFIIPQKLIEDLILRRKPHAPIKEVQGKQLLKQYNVAIRNEGYERKALNEIYRLSILNTNEQNHTDIVYRFSDPKNHIGICSLTESKNNQVMWSLYCEEYTGICIEYDVPENNFIVSTYLLPVKYSRKKENSLIEKISDFYLGNLNRAISKREDFRIGNVFDVLSTKNSSWKFQKEWRIYGNKGEMISLLKIKRIYLGYKVSDTNEKRILELSKTLKFDVYKMNEPNMSTKITYRRIEMRPKC